MGLAAGRALRWAGYSVTLLERAAPGRAASWASAGIIGATLRREHDASTQLRQLSRELWPDFAAAIEVESGLDPEYRQHGCIHLAASQLELDALGAVAATEPDAQLLDRAAL